MCTFSLFNVEMKTCNLKLQSWRKVLGQTNLVPWVLSYPGNEVGNEVWDKLAFMRLSYKSQIPNPPSYPKYDVKRVYPEFSGLEHCIGWGKGERQGIFHKVVQFYESTQKLQIITNIALLSQGLLCSRLKLFICLRIPTKLSIARGRYFQG